MDNIMFGRIEFTIAYNNIIKILNSILTTEELEEFETSCNLIYDSLQYGISNEEDEIIPIQDFSDDNLYSIFRQETNKVFDNILLKFGIKSNIISITEYLTIFTLLQNLKCNLLERESYSQIYYGDYGVEDKLYMLLEDLIDSPIEIIENFDVGDLFWLKVEEHKGKTAFFGGIKNARFKKQITPGDVIEMECEITDQKGPIGSGKAVAKVDGKVAVTAELTFVVGA
jgi:hypothetical protein